MSVTTRSIARAGPALALPALAMIVAGCEGGDGDASVASDFREPQTLEELVVLSGNRPQGPDLVVVGVFSGPVREIRQTIPPPAGAPDLVEVAPGVKVPPAPRATSIMTEYSLTVEESLFGDAKPGNQLTIINAGPASESGKASTGWAVPAAGDRWLVMLASGTGLGDATYGVPPYWQFDVSGDVRQVRRQRPRGNGESPPSGPGPANLRRGTG